MLVGLGLALAGRAGARIADLIGIQVSRSTILRILGALPDPASASPRVVGIDEFALRKGRVYGTVLVDVETRRPVDLLPDRESGTVAAWLASRPGIEVVCRDRAPFYIDAATTGAPQAVQVADRWHLWHNLGEVAERCIAAHRACLRAVPPDASEASPAAEVDPTPEQPWPTGHRFADRARARHAAVHELLAAGHSRRAIARRLRIGQNTVLKYADAPAPESLFHGQWQGRPSKLDPFKAHLDRRWAEGCTNAWQLWEEIKSQGYLGSYGRVRAYIHDKRAKPGQVAPRPPTPHTVAGWILRHPDSLDEQERLGLKAVLAGCPEVDALTGHVRAFARILTERRGDLLPSWLGAVRDDDLPKLHGFAVGLERDLAAVTAGLTLPWSSGVVEGHVNRIKMLKRQMFGRAGFELLRKRVLLAP